MPKGHGGTPLPGPGRTAREEHPPVAPPARERAERGREAHAKRRENISRSVRDKGRRAGEATARRRTAPGPSPRLPPHYPPNRGRQGGRDVSQARDRGEEPGGRRRAPPAPLSAPCEAGSRPGGASETEQRNGGGTPGPGERSETGTSECERGGADGPNDPRPPGLLKLGGPRKGADPPQKLPTSTNLRPAGRGKRRRPLHAGGPPARPTGVHGWTRRRGG